MDIIKKISNDMLSEKEIMILLLIENTGKDYRTIGDWLGISHENVRMTYNKAKNKFEKFAEHGMLSTDLKKK